ncbi:hypothetical protein [Enterococcus sp.]|uniref:hypothetical protein n=1 Tax=Enterococcus sp. TaxID=35783 RepID=UPI002FC7475C
MDLEKSLNEYLDILEKRKAEYTAKVEEWDKEAKEWDGVNVEKEDAAHTEANIWQMKVNSINFAIRNFKEIVMSQC